ncbi:MAG: hypothetical protein KJZ93_02835 [Caldilineaceae bacterium]|nr:hypothetical protein [Caldilineaceae bacterium]
MKDLPEVKRNFQAEVHFALGAVIQGVTVAALGNELARALRDLPFPGAIWVFVTGAQSLLLCIAFWYTFMNNYFFGFRVINLTAKTHFLFATLYLILGLQQHIAIQYLGAPRLWMTLYVLLISTVLAGSWVSSHVTVVDQQGARQAFDYDPGSKAFLSAFLLALGAVLVWYAAPDVDGVLFRSIALCISGAGLILFVIYSIRRFQRHLDVES